MQKYLFTLLVCVLGYSALAQVPIDPDDGLHPPFSNEPNSCSGYTDVICDGIEFTNIGTEWANERTAVVLILAPVVDSVGNYVHVDPDDPNSSLKYGPLCTGTIIANTCNFDTPYLLTANHCSTNRLIKGNPQTFPGTLNQNDVSLWKFVFRYWSTGCNQGIVQPSYYMIHGATVMNHGEGSDFLLLKLNSTPPAESGLYYAGWNRSSSLPTDQTTVSLHHPNGDLMKVSKWQSHSSSTVSWGDPAASTWRVSNPDAAIHGKVEPNSSGAPLFDVNHRIVGQLYGSLNFDCPDEHFYGAFHVTYSNIANYINPYGSSVTFTSTVSRDDLIPAINLQISGPTTICKNQTPKFTASGTTFPVVWSSSNTNALTINSSTGVATPVNGYTGSVLVKATVNLQCGIVSKSLTVNIVNGILATNYSISGPAEVCKSKSAMYTVTNAPAGSTITWSSSNLTAVPINASGVITPNGTFTGSVTITATINGCEYNTRTVNIVNSIASTTYTVSGPSVICAGSTATYSVPNLPAGSAISWSSSNTQGVTMQSNGVATAKAFVGNVTISALINGCESVSRTISVTGPTPAITAVYKNGIGILLTATSVSGATAYRWRKDFINATPIANATNNWYTMPLSELCPNNGDGTYFKGWVSYFVEVSTPTCGWSIPTQVSFYFDCSTMTISQVRSTIIDQSNMRVSNRITSGEISTVESNAKMFPNPANDELNIRTIEESSDVAEVTIKDHLGREVLATTLTRGQTKINIKELKSAIYLVSLRQNGKILTQRIVIQH